VARRAESGMAELLVAEHRINSWRGQAYLGAIQMSREYCRMGKKVKPFGQNQAYLWLNMAKSL